ncbi:hypothetical protein NQZ79_g3139 [Umbelopsis isabellina]|nr:hypothetical protein NQZ79_g3139 [Umbelopsis isabellina]
MTDSSSEFVEKIQALNVQNSSQVDNSESQSSEQRLKSSNNTSGEDHDNATDDEFFDSHEYSSEELEKMIAEANQYKSEGNSFFATGKYDEAISKYEDALLACPERNTQDRAVFFANIAACQMKQFQLQGKFAEAKESCSSALKLTPTYSKALFRRAQAGEKIGSYSALSESLQDYQAVRELDDITEVTRRDCLKAEQRLPAEIKEKGEKEKEEMMGKLKDLGNTLLGKFGLSTDNFQMQKDPSSGNYSVNFSLFRKLKVASLLEIVTALLAVFYRCRSEIHSLAAFMLDDLLIDLLEEIALDGRKGATIPRVWTLVSNILKNRASEISLKDIDKNYVPTADDSFQRFLWPYIAADENIHIVDGEPKTGTDPEVLNKIEYQDYNHMLHLDKLRLVASERLRTQVLLSFLPPGASMTENGLSALEAITYPRENGLTQADLALELDMDARLIFSITKRLVDQGLIIKKPAVSKGNYTALCIHKRYENQWRMANSMATLTESNNQEFKLAALHDEGDGSAAYRSDLIHSQIIDLLKNVSDNVMSLQDITKELGFTSESNQSRRWLARYIDKLCNNGILEKISLPRKGSKASVRAVRLAKCEDGTNVEVQIENALLEKSEELHTGVMEDVPLQYEIYQHIVHSGTKGITNVELRALMPSIPKSFLPPILTSLAQPVPSNFHKYRCPRVKEMVGKEHRYRHFSFQNWLKLQEAEGNMIAIVKDGDEELDSVDIETDPFLEIFDTRTVVAEKRKQDANNSALDRNSVADDGSSKRQKLSSANPELTSKGSKSSHKRKLDESDAIDGTDNNPKLLTSVSTLSTSAPILQSPTTPSAPAEMANRNPKRRNKNTANPETQNTTTLKRMQILLTILERDKVRELNNVLMDDFKKLEFEGQEVHHSVDRRTVSRLGEKLEKEKKARVIKCSIPLLNGSILSKTLLLPSSVSPSDAIVQDYIEKLRERNTLTGKQIQKPKNESSEKRVGNQHVGATSSSVITADAKSHENNTGQRDTSSSSDHIASWNWRVVAKYYGWISASMLRIKMLHKHMLKMAIQAPNGDAGTTNMKLATAKVISQITLKTFLQLFGVHERLPLLDAYLETEANANVTVENLPKQLRAELFQGNNKYRRSLRQCINALCTLQLLTPVKESDSNRFAVQYELQTNVSIRNYREPGHPITRYVPMETLEDHRRYWEELQFLSTGHSRHIKDTDGSSTNLGGTTISTLPDNLAGITSMSSWFMKFDLSRQVREILEKHVDRSKNTTPYKDLRACIGIANECDISVQVKLLSSPNVQQAASPKAHFMTTGVPVNRSVSRIHSSQTQRTSTRADAEIIRDIAKYGSTYTTWKPEELELLLYSYVILRHRSRYAKFRWGAIQQVLPKRTPEICRHQMTRILRVHDKKQTVAKLIDSWHSIYYEAIDKQELEDPNVLDMVNFDLSGQLRFFLHKLRDQANSILTIDLPAKVEDIPKLLELAGLKMTVPSERTVCDVVDDNFFSSELERVFKKSAIRVFPMRDFELDLQEDIDFSATSKIRQYILMVLMTPNELYDPLKAYRTLGEFPSSNVNEALDQLNKDGLIIKTKPSQSRSIPGRGFGLSENHVTEYESAKSYAKMIQPTSIISPMVTKANMMAIMDLFANRQLKLDISRLQIKREPEYVKRTSVSEHFQDAGVSFDVSVSQNDKCMHTTIDTALEHSAMQMQSMTATELISRAEQLVQQHNNPLLLSISKILIAQQAGAISLYGLKERLQQTAAHLTDMQIKEALRLLRSADSPLVYDVGYDVPLIVSAASLEKFSIECEATALSDTQNLTAGEKAAIQIQSNKKFVKLRLWSDIHGNKVNVVKKGCSQAILSLVVKRPGITEIAIYEKLSHAFGRCEVQDILADLEGAHIIRSVCLHAPKTPRLFAESHVYKKIDNTAIDSCKVNCYFAMPNYYSKF